MPSVVIVEDHLLLAETLRSALAARGVTADIAEGAPARLLVDRLLEASASLVLLDLDLGVHGDSSEVIAPLTAAGVRTLVVSGTSDRERVALAFEAGAVGFHPKADGLQQLVAKAQAALSGVALDEALRHELRVELTAVRAARAAAFAPFQQLTDRERDTLIALSNGLAVHRIATEWVVSEATVRSHVRNVLTKLGVQSQLAAVALALRSGWLTAGAP